LAGRIPYVCPAGYWTIGYGHLCDPKHPPITEAEAESYLAADLMTALTATLRYCPVLATQPEGRLAAIVDFTFNLGAGRLQASTLRRRINQADWISAVQELRRWVYGGGRPLLAQNYLQDLLKLAAGAVEGVPVLAAVLTPDRWLLWLGVLFVLSVYHFPTGVVGRLRARVKAGKAVKTDQALG